MYCDVTTKLGLNSIGGPSSSGLATGTKGTSAMYTTIDEYGQLYRTHLTVVEVSTTERETGHGRGRQGWAGQGQAEKDLFCRITTFFNICSVGLD